jgi:tetratricopeptide (TPR) repeat protein
VVTHSYHADDGTDVRMKVWDVATGRHVASILVGQAVAATSFSPDGRWMYTAGGVAPTHRRWDLSAVGENMVPRWEATAPRPDGGLSPDGRIVARSPDVNGIALHDATDDRELVRLPLLGGYAHWRWSADSSRLFVVGNDDKKLYAYDLRLIRRGLAELGLDWDHPLYPPAAAWENDPTAPPLEVRVVGTDAAASPKQLAAAERTRAAGDLAVNPLDPDARYRLGLWMLNDWRPAEAYPHLSAAVALDPRQTAAFLPLAEAALQTGRWAEAAEAAARATAADPRNARAHHLLGLSEAARGRHEEAIRAFSAALDLRANDLAVLLDRAQSRRAIGDASAAEADARRVDELIARAPGLANTLAWELVTGAPGLRNPKRALDLMTKAIARDSQNAALLNTLGVVQYRNGLYAEAATTLEKSLAAGAGASDAYDLFFLAMCHHRLGDPVKARQRFEEAVRWTERAKALTNRELAEFRQEAEAEFDKPR